LDDDVSKYVPGWEDHAARITIRQLLSHTSGLRDAFVLEGLRPEHPDNINQQIVGVLAHARGLNFAPGSQFEYNNSAYTLLAAIVARIAGQTFAQFTEANIFEPLGMSHSRFRDDATRVIPDVATPYIRKPDGFHVALNTLTNVVVGNDDLFTTVGDLLRWEENFADPRVGDAAILREMETPVISTGWPDGSQYGFGLEIADHRGLRRIQHGGGDDGVSSYVVRYPERGLAIAILCNRDDVGAEAITRSIAEEVLEGDFPAPPPASPPPVQPISVSVESLQDKVGVYRDVADGSVGRVFIRDRALIAAGSDGGEYPLTPITPTRFTIPGTAVIAEFVRSAGDKPQELHVSGAGPAVRISRQTAPFAPSHEELREFEGTFTSEEIDGTYAIVARDADLVLRAPTRPDMEMKPLFPDAFSGASLGVVMFSRDARGRVTAFSSTTGGVRGLRFVRR